MSEPDVKMPDQMLKRGSTLDNFVHSPYALRLVSFGCVFCAGVMLLGPWMVETWSDVLVLDYKTTPQEEFLPPFTGEWWHNAWRHGAHPWRVAEARFDRLEDIYKVYEAQMAYVNSKAPQGIKGGSGTTTPRTAFVPCCGDSRVVAYLSHRYDRVLALDVSEEATDRQKRNLERNVADHDHVSLLTADIFDPSLKLPNGSVDFIYDRQGLTSIPPARRSDYVFLLKRAMAQVGGKMYIEGTHRLMSKGPPSTNNRIRGPPFHLDEDQLSDLFPSKEGYSVACDEAPLRDFLHRCEEKKRNNDVSYMTDRRQYSAFPLKCAVWRK